MFVCCIVLCIALCASSQKCCYCCSLFFRIVGFSSPSGVQLCVPLHGERHQGISPSQESVCACARERERERESYLTTPPCISPSQLSEVSGSSVMLLDMFNQMRQQHCWNKTGAILSGNYINAHLLNNSTMQNRTGNWPIRGQAMMIRLEQICLYLFFPNLWHKSCIHLWLDLW